MPTVDVRSVAELPSVPGVYGLHGGRTRATYFAYVGRTSNLRSRIEQHLIRRDSSIATGTSAVGLNPDHVKEVSWWTHPDFRDRINLEAAELIAFEVFNPALRSRGGMRSEAVALSRNPAFRQAMRSLFSEEPEGRLRPRTLEDAFVSISELERRVSDLEGNRDRSSR